MSTLSERLARHFGVPQRQANSGNPGGVSETRGNSVLSSIERYGRAHPSTRSCGLSVPSGVTAGLETVAPERECSHESASAAPLPPMTWGEPAGGCSSGFAELMRGSHHGRWSLDTVLSLSGDEAVLLSGDPVLAGFDPTEAVFFDLETTGLFGGAGALAFLFGSARVTRDGMVRLDQVLIRDPTQEADALDRIEEILDGATALVSFNGKAFDRNVLADRLVMHRRDPDPVLTLPHLDLLHPVRRLFSSVWGRCSLSVVEERRLGVVRPADEVRGAEVPARYYQFLRDGREEALRPVLDHNLVDVLSLVALACDLAATARWPGDTAEGPKVRFQVSRMLIDRGQEARGVALLEELASAEGTAGTGSRQVKYDALRLLGEHCRRRRDWAGALAAWDAMRRVAGWADPEPWRRAAIALEWHLSRHQEALELVEGYLAPPPEAARPSLLEREAFTRRRDRLVRRLARVHRGDPAQ